MAILGRSKDAGPWKDKYLIIIPEPHPNNRQELLDYLKANSEKVVCLDIESPASYWFGDKVIKSHTFYFTDQEEAMAFYLKWDGYGTKIG